MAALAIRLGLPRKRGAPPRWIFPRLVATLLAVVKNMSPIGRWYLVVSDECVETVVIGGGLSYDEYGHDTLYVYARNARRAKALMVAAFRRGERRPSEHPGHRRAANYWLHDTTPFRGMKAIRADLVECSGCGGWGDLRIHGCDDSTCGPCDGTGMVPRGHEYAETDNDGR